MTSLKIDIALLSTTIIVFGLHTPSLLAADPATTTADMAAYNALRGELQAEYEAINLVVNACQAATAETGELAPFSPRENNIALLLANVCNEVTNIGQKYTARVQDYVEKYKAVLAK